MFYCKLGFSESPERVGVNLINHERDWLYLVKDLGVPITLTEFDNLSRKRISRLIAVQEKRLEKEAEEKKRQLKEAERKANRVKNIGTKGTQRISTM